MVITYSTDGDDLSMIGHAESHVMQQFEVVISTPIARDDAGIIPALTDRMYGACAQPRVITTHQDREGRALPTNMWQPSTGS